MANQGQRKYLLDINGVRRNAKVNTVPVRRPLLAMCDFMDNGRDVFFTKDRCWAMHRRTKEIIDIHRRGGKFEIHAKVISPSSGTRG